MRRQRSARQAHDEQAACGGRQQAEPRAEGFQSNWDWALRRGAPARCRATGQHDYWSPAETTSAFVKLAGQVWKSPLCAMLTLGANRSAGTSATRRNASWANMSFSYGHLKHLHDCTTLSVRSHAHGARLVQDGTSRCELELSESRSRDCGTNRAPNTASLPLSGTPSTAFILDHGWNRTSLTTPL
jgi:hypothetical protein